MSPDTLKDIEVNYILTDIKANNFKNAYHRLSHDVADNIGISHHALFQKMMDKEETDHSNIGDGVAIPHLRLNGINRPFTALLKLKEPVIFEESLDGKPVDLICLLISPERDGPLHLRRLSRISRLFKNKDLCDQIRETDDIDAIRSMIISPEGWLLAA